MLTRRLSLVGTLLYVKNNTVKVKKIHNWPASSNCQRVEGLDMRQDSENDVEQCRMQRFLLAAILNFVMET